jgi:hypothetical protein
MSTLESAKTFFPKYKQQLLFLRERDKLFTGDQKIDQNKENEVFERSSVVTLDPITSPNNMPLASSTMINAEATAIEESSAREILIERNSDAVVDSPPKATLPDEYSIPSLPLSLLNDIDRGDLSKFNSHCRNRQILIDTVFFDLTTKYYLW